MILILEIEIAFVVHTPGVNVSLVLRSLFVRQNTTGNERLMKNMTDIK